MYFLYNKFHMKTFLAKKGGKPAFFSFRFAMKETWTWQLQLKAASLDQAGTHYEWWDVLEDLGTAVICHKLPTLDFSYFREIDVPVLKMSITLDFPFTYSQT